MTSRKLKDTLARHREHASVALTMSLRVDRLLDEHRCSMLEKDLRACSDGGWEVRSATAELGAMLPNRRGLYMFVWRPPATLPMAAPRSDARLWYVLYVGQAGAEGSQGTIASRYTGEYRKYVGQDAELLWPSAEPSDRADRLRCFLNVEDLESWFMVIIDDKKIGSLEKRLISLLGPPLNRQGGTTLRPVTRKKAF